MIASGVIIHALSAGCYVLARHSPFADELVENSLAISTFKQISGISVMIPTLDFSKIESQYQQFSNLYSNGASSKLVTKLFSNGSLLRQ